MNVEHEFHRAIGLAKEIANRAEKAEKALEEACKHIEEMAEPSCYNCPLTSINGDHCPNGEEMTDRCWEFIRDYFVEKSEAE